MLPALVSKQIEWKGKHCHYLQEYTLIIIDLL